MLSGNLGVKLFRFVRLLLLISICSVRSRALSCLAAAASSSNPEVVEATKRSVSPSQLPTLSLVLHMVRTLALSALDLHSPCENRLALYPRKIGRQPGRFDHVFHIIYSVCSLVCGFDHRIVACSLMVIIILSCSHDKIIITFKLCIPDKYCLLFLQHHL